MLQDGVTARKESLFSVRIMIFKLCLRFGVCSAGVSRGANKRLSWPRFHHDGRWDFFREFCRLLEACAP